MATEEILATLGVTLAMIGARDLLDLFIRLGHLGERSSLAVGAVLRATVTAGQDRSTGLFAYGLGWVLPALHHLLVLAGGQLAGDLDSADDRGWILLLVAPGLLENVTASEHHRSNRLHAIAT